MTGYARVEEQQLLLRGLTQSAIDLYLVNKGSLLSTKRSALQVYLPDDFSLRSGSLLRQNFNQVQDLPCGCSSDSSCSSSRMSSKYFSCSPNSSSEKLKCPQLAATSSKSASSSTVLILKISFCRYIVFNASSRDAL